MKVVHCFQLYWITKKVVLNESLYGWVGEEVFVVHDETVVDVSVVGEVEGCALEIVVELVPGVFNEGDCNVAKGRRELGANPSSSDLFVSVVTCPENASVECKGHNSSDVGCVEGTLCRMLCVVSANMGMMERVACGFCVHGQGVCSMLELPLLDQGMDCIDEAVFGYRVEEADEVIVGRVEVDICWCLGEVAMEVAPQLRDGQLSWMLWEKVL